MTKPSNKPTIIDFCLISARDYGCIETFIYTHVGLHETVRSMAGGDVDKRNVIEFTQRMRSNQMVLKTPAPTWIDGGRPQSDYLPSMMRFVATLVSPGGTYTKPARAWIQSRRRRRRRLARRRRWFADGRCGYRHRGQRRYRGARRQRRQGNRRRRQRRQWRWRSARSTPRSSRTPPRARPLHRRSMPPGLESHPATAHPSPGSGGQSGSSGNSGSGTKVAGGCSRVAKPPSGVAPLLGLLRERTRPPAQRSPPLAVAVGRPRVPRTSRRAGPARRARGKQAGGTRDAVRRSPSGLFAPRPRSGRG